VGRFTGATQPGFFAAPIYNSIRPHTVLAGLVTAIALDTMLGTPKPDGQITMYAGVPVIAGRVTAIYCDANSVATCVTTCEPQVLTGGRVCAGIDLGSPVYNEGKLIGHTILEVVTIFQDAKLASNGGQKSFPVDYQRVADPNTRGPVLS
jgi:hypothetical protein